MLFYYQWLNILLSSLTVSYEGATYLVGLCQSPNNSNAAIIEQRNNVSHVLGRLDLVDLVGDG